MIAENECITDARKADIRARVVEYLTRHNISRQTMARECGIGSSTVSQVLSDTYGAKGKKRSDDTRFLRALNNWMELDARRRNVVQDPQYVDTSVAREIVTVAEIVSETCRMGVVYGPAQIGKSFTLKSLAGSDRLGHPILLRVDQSHRTPKAFARLLCSALAIGVEGTFDALTRRIIDKLGGTKRMLMIDEAERVDYATLEFIRDVHDQTGCPILLAGKPAIYRRLGFREMGDYSEVVDQLSSRIVIRRDLTERTRREHSPEPLFSADDVRKLIRISELGLSVDPDAQRWLQDRACVIGLGGLGKAVILLYLAYKMALGMGSQSVTVEHLERVEEATIGHEDLDRVDDVVNEPASRQIRRLA